MKVTLLSEKWELAKVADASQRVGLSFGHFGKGEEEGNCCFFRDFASFITSVRTGADTEELGAKKGNASLLSLKMTP